MSGRAELIDALRARAADGEHLWACDHKLMREAADALAADVQRVDAKGESREATHAWIREFVGDHAYAHGLADDVFDLLAERDRLAAELAEARAAMESARDCCAQGGACGAILAGALSRSEDDPAAPDNTTQPENQA